MRARASACLMVAVVLAQVGQDESPAFVTSSVMSSKRLARSALVFLNGYLALRERERESEVRARQIKQDDARESESGRKREKERTTARGCERAYVRVSERV